MGDRSLRWILAVGEINATNKNLPAFAARLGLGIVKKRNFLAKTSQASMPLLVDKA